MDGDDTEDRTRRPPRAVVGSTRPEEEIFGKAYDGRVVRRIWKFVRPYRKTMFVAVGAVTAFTLSQLTIPLTIRFAIDHGMTVGGANRSMLALAAVAPLP